MRARILLASLLFAFVARPATAEQITLTDQAGRVVTLAAPVKRAVLFETYEMIPALNAWDQVAGVSHYAFDDDLVTATRPNLAATAEDVGSMFNVNVERLIALKPDVAIVWRTNAKLEATLADNNIPVIVLNPTSLDGLYEALSLEGRLFGKTAEADHTIAAMKGLIGNARARVADIDKARQRTGVWMMSEPTRLSGPQSMSGQLLALASVRNLAADAAGAASEASVSLEQILSWNPDLVYIWGWARFAPKDLIENSQWADVAAARSGAVFKIPRWSTWSPRYALLVLWTAAKAYPERFRDLDLQAEYDRFFRDVFHVPFSAVHPLEP